MYLHIYIETLIFIYYFGFLIFLFIHLFIIEYVCVWA